MENKRMMNALVMSVVVAIVLSAILLLSDRFLMKQFSIGIFPILLIAVVAGLLLSPYFYWIRSRMAEGPIQATRLTDLELNDRDIREAVDQWVYTHYKKKADGVMDFRLDENGSLVCKVTVRDES